MIHARSDYDGIQDASGKIPEDEPVFVLRAKDITAPWLVREWSRLVDERGGDEATVNAVWNWADKMEAYANANYSGGKVPDTNPEYLR